MSQDFYSVEKITPLSKIPAGAKIHVIGVCGVAMAQLSVELSKQGYEVSGSDKQFYEPMGSFLKSSAVRLCEGYSAENVPADADLIIIGNAVSRDHVEVERTKELKLNYSCFPQILAEILISTKHSIVVAGTHGKSTTTSMIASTLNGLSLDPSYFLGGIAHNLPSSFKIGSGPYSVVEGDEYDSAFFAKVPKFSFYKAKTCIVNAIEFDHADIYQDVEAIKKEFLSLLQSLPADGAAICCSDYEHINSLLSELKGSDCKVLTFGTSSDSDYRIIERVTKGELQLVKVESPQGEFHFTLPLIGQYNAKNALATIIVADVLGLDREKVKAELVKYKGVKRRQEVRFQNERITVIEDFAHHPTSIKGTLEAVSESYPGKKIWAIFEPRSNTSRMSVFQAEYCEIFKSSDVTIIRDVPLRAGEDSARIIDVDSICKQLNHPTFHSEKVAEIEDYILENLTGNDLVVIMSNGSFDGLIDSLISSLSKS
ncbi:MAG: hypothetical protein H6619_00730 [Deltaproteobacteria bacterium]|nr:hypothetical protein [Deltaproteobacteria bacterium]